MTTIEDVKAAAREGFAALEAQSRRGVRRTVTGWCVGPDGQLRMAMGTIQMRGEVYPTDWMAYAMLDAARAAERQADGRPWAVIQTARVLVGPESRIVCAVCDRGGFEE